MAGFRPMLAAQETPNPLTEIERLGHYPMLQSTKLDGIRAIVKDGVVLSRRLKPIPSAFVQRTFGIPECEGFDGELCAGDPGHPNVYQATYSATMTHGCDDPVQFLLFDKHDGKGTYQERLQELVVQWMRLREGDTRRYSQVLSQQGVKNLEDVLRVEELHLQWGFEGSILRRPDAPYKMGRSTLIQGYMLKLKRFIDGEADIIGFEERMHNGNVATVDGLGYTVRTSHKENLVGLGTLGAMQVRDRKTGIEFRIGVFKGLDASDLLEIWNNKDIYAKRIVKYRSIAIGVVDRPRHPRFVGWRASEDL